ncbi:thioredoxin, putative [Trypanosoma cruzi marinkellei]|uniref:Thioredoxin, putative n=1 Tax=Trypanosoma cruzi marinkellei TaxID=85056 RepID=K2PEE0_TRYCR|nr:thioredoxin, putative [Trypanosoma cruzi marinkellei]
MKPLNSRRRTLKSSCPLAAIFLSLPLFFMILLLTSNVFAEAFPFTKFSGVVELTPATFKNFVSSHKPVYILFYAPWCGHCRKIHPEWEKFAQAAYGTVRVGAINADEHSQIAGQFGIRGFPTIKYWNVGEKNINKAQEYNGPRQAKSLQANAMNQITSSGVKKVKSSDALREAAQKAPEKKIVVLFSSKPRIPAIFAVLSHSPRLKSMPFYFVGENAKKEVLEEFGVQERPSIAVLNATEGDIKTVLYPGKQIAYEPIAKFLLACATDDADMLDAATGNAGESPEENDSGKEKNTAAAGGGTPTPALPVRPVRLTAQLLADFCVPATLRVHERAPLCVLSLTSAFTLERVHEMFRNEPLLFFEADEDRDVILSALREDLGLEEVANSLEGGAAHQMLLLRAAKRDTIRYKLLDGIETVEGANEVLQRVLSGDLQLGKKVLQ